MNKQHRRAYGKTAGDVRAISRDENRDLSLRHDRQQLQLYQSGDQGSKRM